MTTKILFFILIALVLFSIYGGFYKDQAIFAAISETHASKDEIDKQAALPIKPDVAKQDATINKLNTPTNENQRAMSTSDNMTADANAETLNQLLATNDLNEFTESQVNEAESACQNRKHPLSDLSCQVLQYHIALVKKQDDTNNPLESDWKTIEQNGGGVELDEPAEVTALSENQQITGESGGAVDVLESSLQGLADRALLDHSAEMRRRAIEEAILMKSEAVAPLLQDALNDEHPANSQLAAEGLRQLRESAMIPGEETDNKMPENVPSNLAHTSLADQSVSHR